MVFERRSRIASVYQVILTPCMSGRLIEVGKNWLLAFFWSILVLQLRESGSIEKRNGLWPPSQNQLCFTGRRDCVTATCKTQWILTRRAESLVFFNGSWTRLLPTSILVFKPTFGFFLGFAECLERFAWFCSGTTNVSEILHLAEVIFWHFSRFRCTSQLKWPIFKMSTTSQCVAAFVAGIVKGNQGFCDVALLSLY